MSFTESENKEEVLRMVRGTELNPGGEDGEDKNRQNTVAWGLPFAKQHSAFIVTWEEAVIHSWLGRA